MVSNHEHGAHVELPDFSKMFGLGPMAWCKRCSRNHRRGAPCDLVEVTRMVNGHKVKRLAHPEKKKPLRKKRVRKS